MAQREQISHNEQIRLRPADKRTKEERLYEEMMGREALEREREAARLARSCRCHYAGQMVGPGPLHAPHCPAWKKK